MIKMNKKGRPKGIVPKYNKRMILAELNINRTGLTSKKLNTALNVGNTLHIYINQLLHAEYVEWFNKKGEKYRTFRITDKGIESEINRNAPEILDSLRKTRLSPEQQKILKNYGIV